MIGWAIIVVFVIIVGVVVLLLLSPVPIARSAVGKMHGINKIRAESR